MPSFSKLHGCGNSFILIDDRTRLLGNVPRLARRLCNRNTGIGADGLILVHPSRRADFRMSYFNADGSAAEMCGNGIRCMMKFLYERRISRARTMTIETGAGVQQLQRISQSAEEMLVAVDMGAPIFKNADVRAPGKPPFTYIRCGGRSFTFVSMGNPHAVTFVDQWAFDLAAEGAAVEHTRRLFPHKTNVEFVERETRRSLRVRVWERGCGVTMACGTGACASVVAAVLKHVVKRVPITTHLDGGALEITWRASDDHVEMIGQAVTIAEGTIA